MKILIVRFSSIGDIILTSPIVRCVRATYPNAEIVFLTKNKFKSILESNPNINRLIGFNENLHEIIYDLKNEKIDFIIDLHNNIRSKALNRRLRLKSYTYTKLNFKKWVLVNFKIDKLPKKHIVERYFECVKPLNVNDDGKGLDYFIPENTKSINEIAPSLLPNKFAVLVLGAAHFTKTIPNEKLEFICENINYPVVLIGGEQEAAVGKKLAANNSSIINKAGELSIHESAQIIKNANLVITPDTGMMHIAAAFNKQIISIWGNTVPYFGMFPYKSNEKSVIIENNNIKCRPCSKIGFPKCPKGHFKCMNDLDYQQVLSVVKQSS